MAEARQIAVIGIDGSGKSTAARFIASILSMEKRVCLIGDRLAIYENGTRIADPVPPTEKFRRWLSYLAKHANSLRWYKYPKLAELFLRDHLVQVVESRYKPAFIVQDGSAQLNLISWASMYKDPPLSVGECEKAIGILMGKEAPGKRKDPLYDRLPQLRVIKQLRLNRLSMPHQCLFLNISPAAACARIDRRGEQKQAHETASGLQRLHSAYLRVLEALKKYPQVDVRSIDAEMDRKEVEKILAECVNDQPTHD